MDNIHDPVRIKIGGSMGLFNHDMAIHLGEKKPSEFKPIVLSYFWSCDEPKED